MTRDQVQSTIAELLQKLIADRREILTYDAPSSPPEKRYRARELKKNYAERFSRELAQYFADALRSALPGILPDPDGRGHESLARASKKPKKLDVNYSNPEIGLGLGISIKTLNFRDQKTQRYTKNYTRVDNEWRAEASDYHERQPYAVMIGVLFLPEDATEDGKQSPSSFGQAINVFRHRADRRFPADRSELFERIFIGLYANDEQRLGEVGFFDVMHDPPRHGPPTKLLSFEELVATIITIYDTRNKVGISWAEEATSIPPIEEVVALQEEIEEDNGSLLE